MAHRRSVAAFIASCLLWSGAAAADEMPIAEQIVDAMNKVFGVHKGFRANHAKGIVVEGSFKATPEAAALSKAVLFNGSEIPLTARFSDSTGLPNIPDGMPDANPHGIAMKFHLPDGSDSDLVINAFKFFPVSNGEDFRDLFLAIAASPPDAPKPTKVEQLVAAHPNIAAANAAVHTPDSFAHEEYHGVNAFVFVNKSGRNRLSAITLCPSASCTSIRPKRRRKRPNFLIDEVQERLNQGPITFHLKAQLASPGDQTSDGSKPWPDDRKEVDLGVVTIAKVAADPFEAQNKLLFLPGQLPDGIEQSDDPMIDIRNAAYPISFARRLQ